MKRKLAAGVLAYFVLALWACGAQEANHITVAQFSMPYWRRKRLTAFRWMRAAWESSGTLGGYTVLGLAGGWASWKDRRIKAALALSPHCSPFFAKGDLGTMDVPMMYQGGTRDFGESALVRKPGGAYDKTSKPKFYVEFEGAGHFAWTNLNRRYQTSIEAYGVAFFDAYLNGETKRLSQLMGSGRPNDLSDLRAAR